MMENRMMENRADLEAGMRRPIRLVPPDKFRPHLYLPYFFSGSRPVMVTMHNAYTDGPINQSMF